MISYQVDSVEEARAVMDAVENRGKLTTFRVQDTEQNVVDVFNKCSEAQVERQNISPGAPSIAKIGAKARDDIMEHLEHGGQPPRNYAEHLKLLWSRGEVKFDGTSFYL